MSENANPEISATPTSSELKESDDMPPHGIRGSAAHETNYEAIGLIALSILFATILAYFIFVKYKRKPKALTSPAPVDPLVAIIDEVKQSFPQEVFGPKEQEDYFYRLSVCLRQLIEKVTQIPASEATIRELRPMLSEKLPIESNERQALIQFLDRADQIKYAGIRSDRGEAEAARESVLQWMLMLTRSP